MPTLHSFSVNQRGFISSVTIILFLILIGVFGWGIYYFRQQPINKELPRQIQLNTPQPSPTPGPLETYTNPTLGFSFDYPKGWKVKEIIVQSSKVLHSILELSPADYKNPTLPFKLLSVDNPAKLSLKDLDQKLSGKSEVTIIYSVDDVYMLTGSGLTVNFRNEGDCSGKKCQIYTFQRDTKVYQLESFLEANVFEQREIFDRIINSFKFADFSKPAALGASASATPH